MSLAVLADHMASKGRGPDSMLIHMSPREVQGLQALAENHGGSLTINPETGLPEAGFLDKLLPTIIGVGISYFSGGTIDPKTAAMIVGGVETARTGDIGKGISAGLGAYGGATLGAGMTTAGSTAMAGEAATLAGTEAAAYGAAQGFSPEAIDVLRRQAIDEGALQQGMSELTGKTTTGELFSKGFEVAKNDPMAYLKANAKPLMYAAGPAILAGESAESNMPKTTTGMIAPYSFDPYSGTYTAANRYPATPTRGAEGGLMGMAAGGIAGYGDGDDVPRQNGMAQGGMYDFAQRSEPVVRMADGGSTVRMAKGTPPAMLTDEQLYQQTGDWNKAAALRDQQNVALSHYNATDNAAVGANINKWITDNPFATTTDINNAIKTSGLTQDIVNPYLTANTNISDAARYALSHASEMPGAGGLAGLNANILKEFAKNPGMNQTSIDTLQDIYKVSDADIQRPLSHGSQVAATDMAKAANYLATNPDVQAWINSAEGKAYVAAHPEFDASDIAFTHYQRYGAGEGRKWEEAAKKPPVTCGPGFRLNAAGTACEPIPIVSPPTVIDATQNTSTNVTTPTSISTAASTALPVGISGAGITTINPNGTITTRPDLTLGMGEVRDDYVRGGGSLGYTSPTFASLKAVEDKYPLRGGSKQSYDYLTGKTDYDPVPYTKTGEIMKPYASSVLGIPMAASNRMYLFDPATKQYKINPDYAIPTYDKDGKKSLNLTNQDVINYVKSPEYSNDDTFVSWMTANNLSPEQVAAATGMPISEVYKKIKKAKPVEKVADTVVTGQNDGGGGGDAAGGLMKLARGGMAQQFNLGDYSDGGRLLRGPGDGVSDSIPASIGGKRPARLADGEFVVPARIVSELGNGSTEAGARKLYAMMDRIQSARRGTVGKGRVAKNSRAEKYLPA